MKKIKPIILFILCAFLLNLGCSKDESANEDTNTAPVVANQNFMIAENNAIDIVIGQIVATDAEGDNLTFSGANAVLSIAADGQITALTTFDFETTTSHTIITTVSDGEQSSTAIITINITDVQEATIPFLTTWQTSTANESITIPTRSTVQYDYDIDWGDGTIESGVTGTTTHSYATADTYQVAITGTFPAILFSAPSPSNSNKIISIDQWGDIEWQTMREAFASCSNLAGQATDVPDLSNVTDMVRMFQNAVVFNQNIGNWDVSNVTDMENMFGSADAFNQNIGNWDVGNVTNMIQMFFRNPVFNQNIGNWNVSSVTRMNSMFEDAAAFNQDIGNWDVSSITDMREMFNGAVAFNQNIGNWDVSSVTDMRLMFTNALVFNQDIGNWDVSNVTSMLTMFNGAVSFNQNIGTWDVSSVTEMAFMFQRAEAFNQNLTTWSVANVISCDLFNGGTSGLSDSNRPNFTNCTP